jgi:pimeloyl-ACP methyl ester carboxylesterase
MAALIPGSTLEIIDHCGHLSTLEQPQRVNEIILNWWQNSNKQEEQKASIDYAEK